MILDDDDESFELIMQLVSFQSLPVASLVEGERMAGGLLLYYNHQ